MKCSPIILAAWLFSYGLPLATLASMLKVPLPAGNAEDSFDVSSSWFGDASAKPGRDSVVLQAGAAAEHAVRQGPWKLIEHENRPAVPTVNKNREKRTAAQRGHGRKHNDLFKLADEPLIGGPCRPHAVASSDFRRR